MSLLIEKEFGFIYLEKNEIACYLANLWQTELSIQSLKNQKYSKEDIENFHLELWKLILRYWDGKSSFRLTRKGKTPDPILTQACLKSGIWYEDLPHEFSVFRPKNYAIEWRKQLHPCKFHKSDEENLNPFRNVGNP